MSKEFNQDVVTKMAKLARLELTAAEVNEFGNQIDKILDYISVLNKVDTNNIEPLYTPLDIENRYTAKFSPDTTNSASTAQALVDIAPESMGNHYLVSKVITEK